MSLTIASIFGLVLNQLLPEVSQTDIETTIRTIVSIALFVSAYFGRLRLGDVNWFGKRK